MARKLRGFTLIGLITALAVLAILSAVAVPSFNALMRYTAATAVLHQLSSALASARLAAITRGSPVTVCPSDDGLTCRRDWNWSDGWIVFLDPDHESQPATADAVLHALEQDSQHLAIQATTGRQFVRYQASGMAGGSNVTLSVCERKHGQLLGAVIVNNAGRPRTQREDAPKPCSFSMTP